MKRYAAVLLVCVATTLSLQGQAPNGAAGKDWAYPLGDQGAQRYSSLTQITTANVGKLTRTWTFHTGGGRFAFPPMIVDSVIYFSAPNGIFAVDGVKGTLIWKYPEGPITPMVASAGAAAAAAAAAAEEGRTAGANPQGRGAAGGGRGGRGGGDSVGTNVRGPLYWAGTKTEGPRIFSQLAGGLAAIDAKTGKLIPTFGTNGVIAGARHNSPPSIYKNLIITRGENEGPKGNTVKAFNVVTGSPVWTAYLKAQQGDPNHTSWGKAADADATPGLWGAFSIDEARGLLFVPTDKPEGPAINDYYGGGAEGDNLYANSLLAIDAATGKLKWYRQLVHHDIWDYDLAAAPILFDVRRNGRVIPAVGQSTKMSLFFVFNRETGEPIFGMEERPVPQSTVPGEVTSKTQPFPVKPEPLARIKATREDLSQLAKVSPEHQKFCEGLWDQYKFADTGIYLPWRTDENVLNMPGAQGGSNWMGMTYNAQLGLLIGNVLNAGQLGKVQPAASGGLGRRGAAPNPNATPGPQSFSKTPGPFNRYWNTENMWSCSPTPWGELVAVNANTGDIAWRVPLGEFDELSKKGVAPTGMPSSGGAITTAGNLVFIGATLDGYFRAFDARNGKELWKDKLPAPNQGMPATYMGKDGKQYVVVSAAGGGFFRAASSDELIGYSIK
ncbi:MAG: PQQ-binding-like beta-propeller repeat protein [Acidobacteriota bacterium]